MVPLIAWRNIWRHKVRSMVVIMSIATGLWAGAFMVAFSWGMYQQYMREAVETQFSHIQIHAPRFEEEDNEVRYVLPNSSAIVRYVNTLEEVQAVTARTVSAGMISSPTTASGVTIYGIFPEDENNVTQLASRVTEGKYLDTSGRNPILIGEKLASKLKVKLRSKIVLTFQDSTGEIVASAFRVSGIYRSKNSTLDEMNVYVRTADLGQLLQTENAPHEIAILLKDDKADALKTSLRNKFPETSVKTWKDLSPELELVVNSFNEYLYIFVGFILLALTFGIVNTMLMAVLERVRETGMLMAIGMSRMRVFTMVVLETVFLALIGGPLGLLIAYLTIRWTGNHGIDISMFSEGLANYGFSSIVYPELDSGYYLPLTLMTVLTAVLSAIYPAIRAVRLHPAEAIRKI